MEPNSKKNQNSKRVNLKKIERIKKEQEKLIPAYVKKWVSIGLSTDIADRAKAEYWCNEAYKIAGLNPPHEIIWSESPLSGAITTHKLQMADSTGKPVGEYFRASVGDYNWDSIVDLTGKTLGYCVWPSFHYSIMDSVRASVRFSIGSSVWNAVWNLVWNSIKNVVWLPVWHHVSESVRDLPYDVANESFRNLLFGQHDAYWLGFYNYFLEVCNLQCCEKLIPLMELAKDCGWWIPYENVCILQEKMTECHLKDGLIHNEKGPAFAYKDGLCIYGLNGVRVPEWVVAKPIDKITKEDFSSIRNGEVRRELVRKMGIENVCKLMNAKVIDNWNNYELLILDLGNGLNRPFLKMINPSIGTYHIEGVAPEIRTVKHALAWRNGMDVYNEPKTLT